MTKIFLPNSDRGQSPRTSHPIASVAPPGAKGRRGQEYSGQEKDRRISPRAVFMTKIFLPKFRPGTVTAHQPSDRQRRQEPRGEEGRNIQGKKKTAEFHRAPSS
ncbi:hypothetical protein [Roseimaritima ulvae]|uniref:Uncharacterized protein n=2 Tax=Roseimaritima ulvae TaxID=980254 RepID=A0A5B9QWX2_9BACT|nr:hypothetical protein [Roseimaritima ulvae]QEG42409.1 hypothetical protein UC8_44440 [Roseimaritima ulvae]